MLATTRAGNFPALLFDPSRLCKIAETYQAEVCPEDARGKIEKKTARTDCQFLRHDEPRTYPSDSGLKIQTEAGTGFVITTAIAMTDWYSVKRKRNCGRFVMLFTGKWRK